VLQHKNAAQYEGTLITQQAAARIMKQAECFLHWTEEVLSASDEHTGVEANPTCGSR
jgi:hypothetical protein